jgi:uncharacterized membrane protein
MDNATPPPPTAADQLRVITYLVYGSFVLGPLIPLSPLIGVIVAAIKYKDAAGTIYQSHLLWVLRTFAMALAAGVVCALLLVIPLIHYLAMLLMAATSLWALYRLVKGVLKLLDGKPIDDVKALI